MQLLSDAPTYPPHFAHISRSQEGIKSKGTGKEDGRLARIILLILLIYPVYCKYQVAVAALMIFGCALLLRGGEAVFSLVLTGLQRVWSLA